MISLYINTTTTSLEIALLKDNKLIDKIYLEDIKKHNTYALKNIDKILKDNKLVISDLKKIYVVSGPGSFTGIRIGIVIAKTIAYSLNIKICVISSLILPIFNYKNKDYYISILKDNNTKSYIGIYDKLYNKVLESSIVSSEINNYIDKYKNNVVVNNYVDIEKVVSFYKDIECDVHTIKPNYIKEVI